MRHIAIHLEATPEQRDLIDRAAAILGKTRSDFMLEAACDHAREVLLDQTLFYLDEARFQMFTEILEKPIANNEGLQHLLATCPPWDDK